MCTNIQQIQELSLSLTHQGRPGRISTHFSSPIAWDCVEPQGNKLFVLSTSCVLFSHEMRVNPPENHLACFAFPCPWMSPGNATATHITASDIIGYYYRQCILDQFLHRQSSIITIHVRYHVAHQIVSDFNLHRVLTASPARKMFCDDNCLQTP